MVHPSHACATVPEAGSDAGTEHGHDDHVLIRHEVLARKHFHSVVLEVVIEIEKRGLSRLAAAGLEFLQRRLPCGPMA